MRRAAILAMLVLAACGGGVDPFRPSGGGGDDARPCDAELAAFRDTVERPILLVRCIGCHNTAGPARQTRLLLSSAGSEADTLANYRAAAAVARDRSAGEATLLLRPTGQHPEGHTGGTLIAETSGQATALRAFVASVASATCDAPAPSCAASGPGARRLRRLTHVEYANTVRALTTVSIDTSAFVADPRSNGFDDDGDTLVVSGALADQILDASERAATAAMPTLRARTSCLAAASPTQACLEGFVASFGRAALRRPLDPDETTRWNAFATSLRALDAAKAPERLVAAFLASPGLLYRAEIGAGGAGLATLGAHEVASELSYMLTASPPDATLAARADDGSILEAATLEAEARRLLATDAARPAIVRFFVQWLDLDRLATVPKDASTYPELDAALRTSMRRETEAFVEHVVFDGAGTLEALLDSAETFVDARLAAHYGVAAAASGDAMTAVTMPPGTHRGLLSHASVLTVHARSNDSSPVHRGRLVRERMLCQPLPPPPSGVAASPPPIAPGVSTRERYAAHASVEPCASCHRLMDPIGFGFERFDGIGRVRGGTTDTHGELGSTPSSDGAFATYEDLAERLSTSEDVSDCFARQWMRYAYGLVEDDALECALSDVATRFRASGGRIEDLLVALVVAPHFRTRLVEVTP